MYCSVVVVVVVAVVVVWRNVNSVVKRGVAQCSVV